MSGRIRLLIPICLILTGILAMNLYVSCEMYFLGMVTPLGFIGDGCLLGVGLGATLGLIDRFKYADRIR